MLPVACPVYMRMYQDGSSTRLERVADQWEFTSTDADGSVECRHQFSGLLGAVQRSVDALVLFARGDLKRAMNEFNRDKEAP